jgi:hypothetical protein
MKVQVPDQRIAVDGTVLLLHRELYIIPIKLFQLHLQIRYTLPPSLASFVQPIYPDKGQRLLYYICQIAIKII